MREKLYEEMSWDEKYKSSNTKWDSIENNIFLKNSLENFSKESTSVLEIGCGNGFDSNFIENQGFNVVGVDISQTIINKCVKVYPKVNFLCGNIFDLSFEEKFDIIYDKGVYHNMQGDIQREELVQRISTLLKNGGIWINISGNINYWLKKERFETPSLFSNDLTRVIEPYFEVLKIEKIPYGKTSHYSNLTAWGSIFKKR